MIPEEQKKTLDAWQTSAAVLGQVSSADRADVRAINVRSSRRSADRDGPEGGRSVMYTDPLAGMVETAQAEAGRRGLTNIQFRQCSADNLPFADDTFDVAVGRLSAMFFADAVTAVREALRVTVEDGYVSFVVWGPKEANPFFSTVTDVIDRFVEVPREDPDAPHAFRFAAPGELAAILENAGAKNVIERRLNFEIKAAISLEQFWQLRTEMSGTLREKMAGINYQP